MNKAANGTAATDGKRARSGSRSAEQAGRRPQAATREELIRTLFEFFYPVHYKAGAVLEATLSRGILTRKQFAVLWIIHSFGDAGALSRKRLEVELAYSLELASPAVSKVLLELASEPLKLVAVSTSRESAREKTVRLTPKGARFLDDSNRAGIRHLTDILAGVSETVMRNGISYLDEIARRFGAMQIPRPPDRADGDGTGRPARRPPPST